MLMFLCARRQSIRVGGLTAPPVPNNDTRWSERSFSRLGCFKAGNTALVPFNNRLHKTEFQCETFIYNWQNFCFLPQLLIFINLYMVLFMVDNVIYVFLLLW